jgi:hypothetical protein
MSQQSFYQNHCLLLDKKRYLIKKGPATSPIYEYVPFDGSRLSLESVEDAIKGRIS